MYNLEDFVPRQKGVVPFEEGRQGRWDCLSVPSKQTSNCGVILQASDRVGFELRYEAPIGSQSILRHPNGCRYNPEVSSFV